MREILFRGKTYDGKWEQGDLRHGGYVHNDSETYIMRSDYALHNIPVDPKTVGQYTGLTDKNGQKIFEGDIVTNSCGRKETVEFYKGRYYPFIAFPEYNCWDEKECEIIGNIHDNPELLKAEFQSEL